MIKSWVVTAALLALSVCGATAQSGKAAQKSRKEAAVVNATNVVADDKRDLKTLREKKSDDTYNFDQKGAKADRKAIRKTRARLLKDRVKRDAAKVKNAL